MLKQKTGGQGS